MSNPQNWDAVFLKPSKSLPEAVDITGEMGVNYTTEMVVCPNIAPAFEKVRRIMLDIRTTGKCGMFVVRWDGQAWCFHLCNPPARVNE